jgi:hypothetical protein
VPPVFYSSFKRVSVGVNAVVPSAKALGSLLSSLMTDIKDQQCWEKGYNGARDFQQTLQESHNTALPSAAAGAVVITVRPEAAQERKSIRR